MIGSGRIFEMALDMHYACDEEGKIWFINEQLDRLCCADIDKKDISAVCKLPAVSGSRCGYIQVIRYQDKVIHLPNAAQDISIYDIKDQAIRSVSIKGYIGSKGAWCKSAGIVQDDLFIIEQLSARLIVFDLAKEEITTAYKIRYLEEHDVIGGQSTIYNDHIYIPVVTKEKIISFDINEHTFEEHFINSALGGYSSICHDERYFWIIGGQYGIVRWDPVTKEVDEVTSIPADLEIYTINSAKEVEWHLYQDKKMLYDLYDSFFCYQCFCDRKYLWVIPERSDSILRISTDRMCADIVRLRPASHRSKEDKGLDHEFLTWGVGIDNKLRVVSMRDHKIYSIDMEEMSYQTEEWRLTDETVGILINGLWEKKIKENKRIGIKDLIYSEVSGRLKEKVTKEKEEIGARIYERSILEGE